MFTYYHQIAGQTVAFTTSDDSKTTWMFSDQVSSTALTRDDTGVMSTQRYTPWGETRTDGGLATDHTFTGQVEDRSTGLRFYNARYQDPVLGRFISPDTIVPNAGNGQDYNRYSYVRNNPLAYSDPSGNLPVCSEESAGGCDLGYQWDTTYVSAWVTGYSQHGTSAGRDSTCTTSICDLGREAGMVAAAGGDTASLDYYEDLDANPLGELGEFGGMSIRQVWQIGSTIVIIACVASTAGACTPLAWTIAVTNVAISGYDNEIGRGSDNCQKLQFALDGVLNLAAPSANEAVRRSSMTLANGAVVPISKELAQFSNFVVNSSASGAEYVASQGSVCG